MTRRTLPSDPLTLLRGATEVVPPEGAAARVAARLERLGVGVATPGPVLSDSDVPVESGWRTLGGRFARWSLAPLGVGIVLGASGQAWLAGRGQVSPPMPALAANTSVKDSAPVELLELERDTPIVAAPPKGTGTKGSASRVAEERQLLDKARRELASDEPARALGFLEQHAGRFTRGELVEEREAMWVNVLARLGRSAEAKARGEQFLARFPKSLMGASVRAAIEAAGSASTAE